jgi:hypothetical protein
MPGPATQPASAPPRFGNGRDWFMEKRFGMFIHWGLHSIPNWNHPNYPNQGRQHPEIDILGETGITHAWQQAPGSTERTFRLMETAPRLPGDKTTEQ